MDFLQDFIAQSRAFRATLFSPSGEVLLKEDGATFQGAIVKMRMALDDFCAGEAYDLATAERAERLMNGAEKLYSDARSLAYLKDKKR